MLISDELTLEVCKLSQDCNSTAEQFIDTLGKLKEGLKKDEAQLFYLALQRTLPIEKMQKGGTMSGRILSVIPVRHRSEVVSS